MTSSVITPPHTYAEWIIILDMFREKSDDESVFQAMHQGTIEWQSGVAERFARKFIDTVNYRMNRASDRFQTEISRSNGEERNIVRALLSLRKEMSFLARAIDLPAIPEKDRQHYYQLVVEQANNIQSSLEDSARKDRSGKLASIIRNNKVNAFCEGV